MFLRILFFTFSMWQIFLTISFLLIFSFSFQGNTGMCQVNCPGLLLPKTIVTDRAETIGRLMNQLTDKYFDHQIIVSYSKKFQHSGCSSERICCFSFSDDTKLNIFSHGGRQWSLPVYCSVPPLWFRLKYLNIWMDCHEILCRHSSSPRTYPLTFPPVPPGG